MRAHYRRLTRRLDDTLFQSFGATPAAALREAFAGGYGRADLGADLLAGLVVGIVALPLSMALAIASGVPPQYGLYTAIVAGAIAPALGGSRTQVTGPTAAFVVLLAPVSHTWGLGGLMLASAMAGAIQIAMGLGRLGRLVQFVPHPVTSGFTAGIAVVIATLQLRDLLGLEVGAMPESFLEKLVVLAGALPTTHPADLAVGLVTLGVLVGWQRLGLRMPGHLAALAIATALGLLLPVATIGTRFDGGIPAVGPSFAWPWNMPGPDGAPIGLSYGLIRDLLPPAFAIAMLGAIESLLSAVIADGMARTRHDPDAELLAQGVANLVGPTLGGFAATGAIARTATNIRAGARSPIAAIVHAAVVLSAVLVLAPVLALLPMAALAAMLLVVAYNMSEAKHVARVLRVAPKSDALVLITCFGLTVAFDMVVAVTVGVVLAAFLFMRRMVEISGSQLAEGGQPGLEVALPRGVILYRISGPLFFGAAQKAMSALDQIARPVDAVIFDMAAVPVIDATGMVNLESAVERLARDGIAIVLAGVQPQPEQVLRQAGIVGGEQPVHTAPGVAEAVAQVQALLSSSEP